MLFAIDRQRTGVTTIVLRARLLRSRQIYRHFVGAALLATFGLATAGEADVVDGKITALGDGRYRIDATVLHADTGWDHYADRWDVLAADGRVLGSRELAHPHENEQPFTRSLTLNLPEGVSVVILQAHDSVHELGGKTFELAVPAP